MSMTYDEFKEAVYSQIRDYLPKSLADSDISIMPVIKNNDTLREALVIHDNKVNIAPSLYLDSFYGEMQDGHSFEEVMNMIVQTRVDFSVNRDMDTVNLLDFDHVKEHLTATLVNADYNKERLSGMPHTLKNDLAIIYQIDLGDNEFGKMVSTVNNEMQAIYGVSTEELHAIAMENTCRLENVTLKTLTETMEALITKSIMEEFGMSEEEARDIVRDTIPMNDDQMHVLTNTESFRGSISIMNEAVLDMAAAKLGGDFFILPSSIHEVILVPASADIDYQDLEEMVRNVNETEVSPEERLSDRVYYYRNESRELVLAADAAVLVADKVVDKTAGNLLSEQKAVYGAEKKPSIREMLKQKKEQAKAQNASRKAEQGLDRKTPDKKGPRKNGPTL